MRKWIGILGLLVLAGCGGSGSVGQVSRFQQAAQLSETLGSSATSDPAQLPASGTARFDGFMTARLPTGPGGAVVPWLGDLTIAVDFANSRAPLAGGASNFSTDTAQLDGALTLSGGALMRDTVVSENYSFTGDLTGRLRQDQNSFEVDGAITGEFHGRGQSGVSGLVFGDVTGPRGQDIFDGSFAATRSTSD